MKAFTVPQREIIETHTNTGCWIAGRSNLILFTFTSAEFGPFSSVWTATIARVGAFFRIFRDLQDLHSFAPLRIRKFSKNSSNFLLIFCANFAKFCCFSVKIVVFRTDFDEILSEFDEM